jgi:hypothetical protein
MKKRYITEKEIKQKKDRNNFNSQKLTERKSTFTCSSPMLASANIRDLFEACFKAT